LYTSLIQESLGFDCIGITDALARDEILDKKLRTISVDGSLKRIDTVDEDFFHVEEISDDPLAEDLS
jgi:hypothetical protein